MTYNHKKQIMRHGYISVPIIDDDEKVAQFDKYELEHRVIAAEMIGRPLKAGEDVHHLDENKLNNSPDNLIVISGPMHAKLHSWLEKNVVTAKPDYQERKDRGCVRCATCSKPIDHEMIYCSTECHHHGLRRAERPSKEELHSMLWEKPATHIAKEFGVSDVAINKWAKAYEIEKPPRGYWAKKKAEEALKDL